MLDAWEYDVLPLLYLIHTGLVLDSTKGPAVPFTLSNDTCILLFY